MLDAGPLLRDDETICPRCDQPMERGFVNAGKGPLRWVRSPRERATIFGGDRLVRQHRLWGRHVVHAARCARCQFGVFVYPGPDEFGPSR